MKSRHTSDETRRGDVGLGKTWSHPRQDAGIHEDAPQRARRPYGWCKRSACAPSCLPAVAEDARQTGKHGTCRQALLPRGQLPDRPGATGTADGVTTAEAEAATVATSEARDEAKAAAKLTAEAASATTTTGGPRAEQKGRRLPASSSSVRVERG